MNFFFLNAILLGSVFFSSMQFSSEARVALFNEPPADRLDIAVGAILEAMQRRSLTVSAADVRIALMRFEQLFCL